METISSLVDVSSTVWQAWWPAATHCHGGILCEQTPNGHLEQNAGGFEMGLGEDEQVITGFGTSAWDGLVVCIKMHQ